jgi:hypothetical protein
MRRKSFRPTLEGMESRVALSTSSSTSFFTEFFDNLFGKSTTTTSSTPTYTPAEIARIKAKRAAAKEAQQEHLAAVKSAHGLAEPGSSAGSKK